METKHYKRITVVAYIVVALVLIGMAVFFVLRLAGGGGMFSCQAGFRQMRLANPLPYSESDVYELKADELRSLDIDWASGSVAIRTDDRKTIEVKESGTGRKENEALGVEFEDGHLKISFRRTSGGFFFFGGFGRKKDLTVTLPISLAGSLDKIRISAAGADVTIRGIAAEEGIIDMASGRLDADDVTFKSLRFDAVSGDHTVRGSIDRLEIDMVSGSSRIELNNRFDLIDIDKVSGDVELYIPKDSDLGVNLDNVSGDIESDLVYKKNGAQQINIDSVSGDLKIRPID